MRKFLVVTVLSACISFGASAEACTISPIDQGLFQNDHNRILEESDIIVLAVVTGFRSVGSPPRDDEGIFEFAIIETVKGTLQGAIEGFGVREDENFSGNPYSRYRFSDRNDRMFWETGIGRTTLNNTMCQLQPTFREGARYLLILGGPQDSKNYELIASEDDKWLDYVRRYFEIAK